MNDRKLKYPPEFKAEVCEYAKKENILRASSIYDINRKTIAKWFKTYKIAGINGVSLRKKREDKQKTKLDLEKLELIYNYRKQHPDATLAEVKKIFSLDCSLNLISSKLKNTFLLPDNLNTHEQNLIITYKIFKQAESLKKYEKVYRFEIYDNLTKSYYFGLSQDRNVNCLCIFISCVVSALHKRGRLNNTVHIVSNIQYLTEYIRNRAVFSKQKVMSGLDIDILYTKNLKLYYNQNRIYHKPNRNNDLLSDSYRELFNLNKNEIFIPPIQIDNIFQSVDSSSIFNQELSYFISSTQVSNSILKDVVKQIEIYGDQAKINFDFDKALDFYSQIYSTAINCPESEGIKINVLFKQAIIYYHLDKYSKTKEIIYEILKLLKKCKLNFNPGHAYYYLAMVQKKENDYIQSDKNFSIAGSYFLNDSKRKYIFDYFRTCVNRQLNANNYKSALGLTNKYLAATKRSNDPTEICDAYDSRGIIYFQTKKYSKSENDFLKMKEIATENLLYKEEMKSLCNLLTLYTQVKIQMPQLINLYIERLEYLSKKITKQLYLFQGYQLLGSYYYNKAEYDKAIVYFTRVKMFFKRINNSSLLYRSTHYLALSNYYKGNYEEAIKLFKEVCRDVSKNNIYIVIHSYNFIGRIYNSTGMHSLSVENYKKSLKYAILNNDNFMKADALKCIGFYFKKENSKKSLNYFKRALRIFKIQKKLSPDKIIDNNIAFIRDNMQELYLQK